MSIWPVPKHAEFGASTLWLSDTVKFNYTSTDEEPAGVFGHELVRQKFEGDADTPPRGSELSTERILELAFMRVLENLKIEKFVPFEFHVRGDTSWEPDLQIPKRFLTQVNMVHYIESQSVRIPSEAYAIIISEDGIATLSFRTLAGGLNSLSSFSQLFYSHSDRLDEFYTSVVPCKIQDSPLFIHRGLNLDIARNRITPKAVMRTLEVMSLVKMNVLHIHATDSQSWPIEIPSLPDLAEKGAYHKSQIWSASDLKQVQEFGAIRGIEVYLEIDMPGHSASIHYAYPDLIVGFNMQPWQTWALEPPSGQLRLESSEVSKFIRILLEDVLARTSQYANKFHLGCDELNLKVYSLDSSVNSSDKDTLEPLFQNFFDHVFEILGIHQHTPIAWEEILLDLNIKVPKNTIIQSWRGHESVSAIVGKGHRVLFGPASHWYLDAGYGAWIGPDPNVKNSSQKDPFPDWNGPYKNWRRIMSYDPLEGIAEDKFHLIIGGEVHLWCEMTDSASLDAMLWPRAAAAADVLWRGNVNTTETITRQLSELRERLVRRGYTAHRIQMEWGSQNCGMTLL